MHTDEDLSGVIKGILHDALYVGLNVCMRESPSGLQVQSSLIIFNARVQGEPLAEVRIFSEANENTTEIGCMRIAICSGLNGYDVAVQTQAKTMCVMHFELIT